MKQKNVTTQYAAFFCFGLLDPVSHRNFQNLLFHHQVKNLSSDSPDWNFLFQFHFFWACHLVFGWALPKCLVLGSPINIFAHLEHSFQYVSIRAFCHNTSWNLRKFLWYRRGRKAPVLFYLFDNFLHRIVSKDRGWTSPFLAMKIVAAIFKSSNSLP